jgi:4-hydroxy-tetrahydrodipicolinate reductase
MDLHHVVEHKGHNWIGQDCGEILLGGEHNILVTDDLNLALESADVVIDFSTPDTSLECLKICSQTNTAHVIGTTGFESKQESKFTGYAERVVVVKAGNMSLGINILTSLVERISHSLDLDFDIEILEMHHRNKVDAPSGTALMLGEAAAKGKGKSLAELRAAVREGISKISISKSRSSEDEILSTKLVNTFIPKLMFPAFTTTTLSAYPVNLLSCFDSKPVVPIT